MFRVLQGAVLLLAVAPAFGADEKAAKEKGGFVHVVLFTMKKGTSASAVEDVVKDCHKVLAKIAAVRSVKAGRPAEKGSPVGLKKNYDLALLVLIDDADGLKAYLDDPLHVAFVKKHGEKFDMEKLQVFDFMNQQK
jgi:hypothetical protein